MKPSQEHLSRTVDSSEQQEESRRQPVWHVIVLSSFTMFAYSIVWFFKNWYQLSALSKHETSLPVDEETTAALKSWASKNAYLQTLGLLIPLWQLCVTTRFFADILRLYPEPLPLLKQQPLLGGALMTGTMVALLYLFKLPGLFYLLYLSGVLPLAAAQYMLNRFWETIEDPALSIRQPSAWAN